jgi:predicted nucleotidyltransferase
MNFGLSEKCIEMMVSALCQYKEIEKAGIFGSRARGNYKNGSDVDLVIYGPQITSNIVLRLSMQLNEELPLPYYFDIVHYESIKDQAFKDQIDTDGKRLWCLAPIGPYLTRCQGR